MMAVFIRSYQFSLPKIFEERVLSEQMDLKGVFGRLPIPKDHRFFPKRSDAKIMRKDVIASIIVINELLEKLKLSEIDLRDMGLFVANGSFLEEENKNMSRTLKTLERISGLENKIIQLQQVYKSVPPLTALETLTNSTMSFIAQYSKIKGSNSTFGTTSYSGFLALSAGIINITSHQNRYAMVGGANGSGVYSALNYLQFFEANQHWKESAACSFLLLQSDDNEALAEISQYRTDGRIPSLLDPKPKNNWASFLSERQSEMVVFSGGFTPEEFEKNKKEVDLICNNNFSWNEEYGNLGAAAMMLNIAKAVSYLETGQCEIVDILDRDPYGRETYVELKKVINV